MYVVLLVCQCIYVACFTNGIRLEGVRGKESPGELGEKMENSISALFWLFFGRRLFGETAGERKARRRSHANLE